LQNDPWCPLNVRFGLFLFVFLFLHLVEHHHINYFCGKLKSFGSFEFFYAPTLFCFVLSTFNHWEFFLHLPPICKKHYYAQKRTAKVYFSLVEGLSKMAFLHFKRMHLRSISLAFMRVCKMVSHYSFK
jgi:hypothetical protein